MQDKRDGYIDQLLSDLKALEERVISVKNSDALPFSFFSESFNKTQKISRLLHEMQLMQIDDMKRQMERLVLFLSESETQSDQGAVMEEHHAQSEPSRVNVLHEYNAVSGTEEDGAANRSPLSGQPPAERKSEADVVHEGNRFAGGIVLPEYKNPRNVDHMASQVKPNPANPETEREVKPINTTLNDTIQATPAVLDLKRGISLNDRFLFQRELFNNDRHMMNNVMIKLNAFDSYNSAEAYLRNSTSWNFDDPAVKNFLLAIKKGFE